MSRVWGWFKWCSVVSLSFIYMPMMARAKNLTIPRGVLIASGLNPHFVAKCTLFLAILLLWTTFVGKLLKLTLRLPVIAGQIIGGVLLGPSFLKVKSLAIFSGPFLAYDWATSQLYALASTDIFIIFILLLSAVFTVPYLLWIAGHETDIKDILNVGVTAISAGLFGALVPIVMVAAGMFYGFYGTFSVVQALALGLVFSATSVSIPIAMFFSKNKMHLRVSKATLGAAVIDDIIAVIILSLFLICLQGGTFGEIKGIDVGHHAGGIWQALLYMVVSFAVIFSTGYFIIPPLLRQLKRFKLNHLIAPVANGVMFLYFSFAELIGGLSGITGAYFAGLFHRMGDKRHQAEKVISPFVNAVLLPIFLGSIGLQVDITILSFSQWGIVLLLLFLAVFSKHVACFMSIGLSNLSGRRKQNRWSILEGYLFGSSMAARGEVGLVVATILHGSRVLPHDVYVIAVVVIVLSAVVAPVLLSIGFSALDARLKKGVKPGEYILNIGLFRVIGSTQMFNIIVGRIEALPAFKNTTIGISEGRKVVNIEGHNVKIILSPNEGILFEGNKRKIEQILRAVKNGITAELESVLAK